MTDLFGKQFNIKELNMYLYYDLIISFLGMYVKEMKIHIPPKTLLQKCS